MSHAHTPPELPDVTDEAGETPSWVPMLGLVIFVLSVAGVWWAHHAAEAQPEDGRAQAEQP